MNIDKLAQQLRKTIAENDVTLEEQEKKIVQLIGELEGMKQNLMGLNLDFADIEKADAEEFGDYGGNISSMAAYGGASSKWKGKDVSHLQQSVLDQFKYLDEDSDDDWGDMDMFKGQNVGADLEKELEKQLNAAMKREKKGG